MRLRFSVLILLSAPAPACRPDERPPTPQSAQRPLPVTELARDSLAVGSPVRVADSSILAERGMWFLADRAIDLTADGRPDTVLLRAEGSASDSLLITVTFLVDGQEAWRTQWHSDHMLIDPPDFPDGELSRAAYVRQELTKAIESVTVSRFDESGYVHLADSVDSSLVRNPPAQQVSIAYGYETYLVLVWEAPQRQFSIVWGCC